ncbi:hypothetical protein ABZ814_02925 [Micromonospora musae]|uniref:hypothetical protein n=1 Tax=Micromonospora musae TaxID=1894970 RepID=UPI00340B5E6F
MTSGEVSSHRSTGSASRISNRLPVVEELLALHSGGYGGVHVGYVEVVQLDHLGQDAAGVVGGLEQPRVYGLEVPDQTRLGDKLVVAVLNSGLALTHPAPTAAVRGLDLAERPQQVLGSSVVSTARPRPGV